MNFTLLTTAIAAIGGVIAGGALAWQIQAGNISEINLKAANERITAARVARATIERSMGQIAAAQANATVRSIRVRADADSARNVANGLRVSTAAAVRTATDDASLCSDTAATLGELFNRVTAERRELAEKAQRHTIDIQALMERQQ